MRNPDSLLLKNWIRAGVTPPAAPDPAGGTRFDLRLAGGAIAELSPHIVGRPWEQVIDLGGACLVAGLIDCHVHLSLGGDPPWDNARAQLRAGVTALRSLGDRAAPATPPGSLLPTTVFAGRALARAGRYGGFLGREVGPADRLGRLVEEEVSQGARVVKVILSGSVDFERETADGPYFSAAELGEVVAAASSLGVPVACHANGPQSVRLAAAAGVASIEHGILAGEEGIQAMAEAGTRWVPTLTPLHNLAAEGRWPALRGILRAHQAAVARGVALGVTVLPGTDGGSPGVPHGSLFAELALLARAGLSGEDLLAAATWKSADLLGLPAGYGRLRVGAATDLVWFRQDPFRELETPGGPRGAVLAGRLAAGPDLA